MSTAGCNEPYLVGNESFSPFDKRLKCCIYFFGNYPPLVEEVHCIYILRLGRTQSIIQSCVLSLQFSFLHFTQFDQIKKLSKHVANLLHFFKTGMESSESLIYYHDKVVCYICLLWIWGIFIFHPICISLILLF